MGLLIVGSVAFDSIETVHGKAEMVIGGAGQYIAYAASIFTDDIHLVSIVGDDFPQEELEDFRKRGINIEGIEIVEGQKSFFWKGIYHEDMNSRTTLITDLNVLENFNPVIPNTAKDCEYIMLGNLHPDIQMSILNQLNKPPKFVVIDTMDFWIQSANESLLEVLKKVDLVTINDEEARMLSGVHSLEQAAKIILDMGPKNIIIKKGEHGALLFHKEGMFYSPAVLLPLVIDPTGAGDTFAGGLIGYIQKSRDTQFENIKRAMIMGSTIASFNVEDFSNINLKKITRNDVLERASNLQQMISVKL